MIPLWVGRVGERWSPNGKGAECPRQRRDPALQLLIKSGLCSSNEFLLLSLNSQTVGGKKEMDPAPNNPPGSSLCPHGGSWGDLFYTDGNATCRFRLRVLYRKSPQKIHCWWFIRFARGKWVLSLSPALLQHWRGDFSSQRFCHPGGAASFTEHKPHFSLNLYYFS